MSLAHDNELLSRAERLLEDVGPLHTVALLGFSDEDSARIERGLASLKRGPWTFLDLRGVTPDGAREMLRPRATDDVLVLATRTSGVPRPILNLVHAAIDRSARFDLGDYVEIRRNPAQSVLLVVEGASEHEALSPELRRIPYEDLIP